LNQNNRLEAEVYLKRVEFCLLTSLRKPPIKQENMLISRSKTIKELIQKIRFSEMEFVSLQESQSDLFEEG